MFTLRRWWDRYRLQIVLASLALVSAVALRETNSAILYETYQVLTRPFQSSGEQDALLTNARVQELQQRLLELESQNQQLKATLGAASTPSQPGITAPVIGRSADHWWQHLVLGRGQQDGIRKSDIVMAPGGVVGRIIEVTGHTSRVLLLSDPASNVGVTISRSRYMGYVRGQASNRVVMEFFDKVPDVRVGDTVTTSSLSRLFAPGLPIGVVESVDLNKSPAPEATIALSAPVSFLEWVVVQSYNPPETQDSTSPDL
jgi:rod shape-determining protein MreC